MSPYSRKPLVTVVIPTYQRPRLLRRAVESVLAQTFRDFRVLVCDNASGDETAEVVHKFARHDPRVEYRVQPRNLGPVANFNYGLQQVQTPFFVLLSDDNVLVQDFLARAVHVLQKQPDTYLFLGNTVRLDGRGRACSRALDGWPEGRLPPPDGFFHMAERGAPNWEGALFRSEVVEQVGLLQTDLSGSTDQDYLMRVARSYPIFVCKTPCAYFVEHDASWSARRSLEEVAESVRRRFQVWLTDPGLPVEARARLGALLQRRLDRTVRHFVCHKALLAGDRKTLQVAQRFDNGETRLSRRTRRLISLARLAERHGTTRPVLVLAVRLYLHLRRKMEQPRNATALTQGP